MPRVVNINRYPPVDADMLLEHDIVPLLQRVHEHNPSSPRRKWNNLSWLAVQATCIVGDDYHAEKADYLIAGFKSFRRYRPHLDLRFLLQERDELYELRPSGDSDFAVPFDPLTSAVVQGLIDSSLCDPRGPAINPATP